MSLKSSLLSLVGQRAAPNSQTLSNLSTASSADKEVFAALASKAQNKISVTPHEKVSLFLSSSFWGILLMYFTAVSPSVDRIVDTNRVTRKDVWLLLRDAIPAVLVLAGRLHNSHVYTPKYLPGPSKEDA
jgi:hypothetical protein